MLRHVLIRWGAFVVVAAAAQMAHAQDDLIGELYGRGVHAFFSRDYEEAHKQLTASIEQGSRDPRCFYFRGLAYARLGRPEESAADIKQGAALELANSDQLHSISNSLQRVQGPERLVIEKERAGARLEVSKKAKALREAMYERWKHDEEKVIRKPQSRTNSGVVGSSGKDDLFAAPAGGAPAPKPVVAKAPPKPVEDPFADKPGEQPDETAPANPESEDDPLGAGPAAKPARPAAPKPAVPKEDDPFADEPASKPPAKPAEKPAPKKADDDDPFK